MKNSEEFRAYINAVVDRINNSGWDGPVDQEYFYEHFINCVDPAHAADEYVFDREE